ncbi:MAG: DNA-processing protein DprA [Spirochaetaceae bacterium]|jgi:DNA processing protein|nr:DNA-processing protein DprA [Spirochaetaceae bacterium]
MDNGRGLLDLMIARIPGLSCKERIKLLKKFDREADLAVCSKEDIGEIAARPLKAWDPDGLRFQAEEDLLSITRTGMGYASWPEPEYPPLLRELYDPPALVFYRGVLPDPGKPLAAVVGTRRPSSGAAIQAFDLGRDLARAGIPVVSGLALGIDAFSHRGNLEGGAPTVAVLGSGLDRVYPASNRGLARRIVEEGGALLSEYPPGTRPARWNFPARNRIIAGLARAVIIVEAPEKSGALITANFALELGRELYVASAGLASPLGAGTRALAEDGAGIVSGIEAIARDWGLEAGPEIADAVPDIGSGLASSLARSLNLNCEDGYGR